MINYKVVIFNGIAIFIIALYAFALPCLLFPIINKHLLNVHFSDRQNGSIV
ncbi:MAG: hypothetical protein KKG25_03485 [Bacteroidetes bacterium]|nr:hypothetical protein [Bacteroidota bacterium]MBU1483910.1 hypothetical protein [Bacteroidota bacterium]MBU2266925.1 hypothetical protein [Bacteroidota bacterium]MBU2377344.1 hypothetical protein [Bacteroidota bacterium]